MTRILTLLLALAWTGAAHADATMRAVSGQLAIGEAVVLPADAHVSVVIRAADGAAIGRGESRTDGRQSPLPFRVWLPATAPGTLTAAISVDGQTGWRSPGIPVQPGTAEADLGTIAMERVADLGLPEAAPAEEPFVPATEPAPAEPDPAETAPAPEAELTPAEPEPAPAEPEPAAVEGDVVDPALVADAPARFLCGDDVVTVAKDDETATVTVGPIDIEMRAVPAASGARFEVPDDPGTFFWSRGDRALVSLAGVELPECELLGPAQ